MSKEVVGVKYIDRFEDIHDPDADYDTIYYYKNPGIKVKEGDLVLVINCSNSKFLNICRIYSVISEEAAKRETDKKLKYFISKIDVSKYEKVLENEKRLSTLEGIIEKKYEALSKIKLMEAMGEADPEIKKLVDEYKSLL